MNITFSFTITMLALLGVLLALGAWRIGFFKTQSLIIAGGCGIAAFISRKSSINHLALTIFLIFLTICVVAVIKITATSNKQAQFIDEVKHILPEKNIKKIFTFTQENPLYPQAFTCSLDIETKKINEISGKAHQVFGKKYIHQLTENGHQWILDTAYNFNDTERKLLYFIRDKILFGSDANISQIEYKNGVIEKFTIHHNLGARAASTRKQVVLNNYIDKYLNDTYNLTFNLAEKSVQVARLLDMPKNLYLPIEKYTFNTSIQECINHYDDFRIFLGEDVHQKSLCWQPKLVPHLLLGGSTGGGKTGGTSSIIAQIAAFGAQIIIIDFKNIEFTPHLRWPNVQFVSGNSYQAITAIHQIYMEVKKRQTLTKKEINQLPPVFLFIDEFSDLSTTLELLYKKYGDKQVQNSVDEVANILRIARTMRIHVIYNMQRNDTRFADGEIQMNTKARIFFGNATQTESYMFWSDPDVSTKVPLGIPGRAMARAQEEIPRLIQGYYFPELDKVQELPETEQATSKKYWYVREIYENTSNLYPRIVLKNIPPPLGDTPAEIKKATGFTPYEMWQNNTFLLATQRPDLDPTSSEYIKPELIDIPENSGIPVHEDWKKEYSEIQHGLLTNLNIGDCIDISDENNPELWCIIIEKTSEKIALKPYGSDTEFILYLSDDTEYKYIQRITDKISINN